MSKSAIYTTNGSNPTVAAGGIVPVGSATRRYGCNIRQDGNAITLCGQGYYLVNVSATVAPTAAGTVSLTAQKDGVAIKVDFKSRGGVPIGPKTVKVTYMKNPAVDLTERVRAGTTGSGIALEGATVPAGEHQLRVEVSDAEGRSSSRLVNFSAQ